MTRHAVDDAALRTRAEEVLTTLAGSGARLREDQWTAIRALVAERRRALVVPVSYTHLTLPTTERV